MLYAGNASSHEVRLAMVAGEIAMISTPAEGRNPAALHIDKDCDERRTALERRSACPIAHHHAPAVRWLADNGCFGEGYPGDDRWLAWLQRHQPSAPSCLFATAPDVVGDAGATLERSLPHLPAIRELGYKAALVGQDGLERLAVPWNEFDVLFLGGSTSWKLGLAAYGLTREARRLGKQVHMGRVNSGRRWSYAEMIGCASVDGTFFTRDPVGNLDRARNWFARPPRGQSDLFDAMLDEDAVS